MSEDPWIAIDRPDEGADLNAQRVDPLEPWDFFWAKDARGHVLLVLRHQKESTPNDPMPVLRGIDVAVLEFAGDPVRLLTLRLTDPAQREIFQQLCLDIMGAASRAKTEAECVARTLGRTWRWHHLLRTGSSGTLSPQRQQGLIGELRTIELLQSPVSLGEAILAWTGPAGSPKDFSFGRLAVEAKARRGGARPFVRISSPDQLDDSGVDQLFLHVVEVDRAPAGAEGGFTLPEYASDLREMVEKTAPSALVHLEQMLAASGFSWEHPYEDRWLLGGSVFFRIGRAFPRIVAADVPSGVSGVKYDLALVDCRPYTTTIDDVYEAMEDSLHGN